MNIPPINATQAAQFFSTYPDPLDLAGVVIWQDQSDTSPDSLTGTPTPDSTGTLYLPGAAVTLQGNAGTYFGQIVAQSVTVAGSGTLQVVPSP